ncbi:hypothetical protein CBR_g30746 [Chara braunii]|uniref:Uncharacterized protein n=1 Tax=Chara braunii TaxID=69332 RepID=A0A388LDJ7_CHABU|nr:hypothetical protein CBR_g30746 [Chara braunii]|eukprot:GBG80378.1 hypothetical protein CBR_g30746 [Chara braunii]
MSNANVNTAIVPAQSNALVTYPVANSYGGGGYGFGCGGGLKPRVETLESTVAELKAFRDAEVEREKARKDEEEKVKKDKEDEERRQREKTEREELYSKINVNIAEQLKPVRLLESKKASSGENDEVKKLKLEVERLLKAQVNTNAASTSESELERFRREQEAECTRAELRFAAMEQDMAILKKANEEALLAAEQWKTEALRPGNKRGSVAVTPSPAVGNRTRPRVTVL